MGSEPLRSIRLGLTPYEEATGLQHRLAAAVASGDAPGTLLLLEHPPVLTKGRRADPRELGMGEDWYRMQGIEIADSDRGGRVTYHGPGQLVAYPIVDLAGLGSGGAPDVPAWVASLECVMIAALGASGVMAQVFSGLTGVWTAGRPPVPEGTRGPEGSVVGAVDPQRAVGGEARKIGSIGIHVSRGVSTHGLAVNVNNDLQPFEWIVPCGIDAARMTSVAAELGRLVDFDAFADEIDRAFAYELGREIVRTDSAALPHG